MYIHPPPPHAPKIVVNIWNLIIQQGVVLHIVCQTRVGCPGCESSLYRPKCLVGRPPDRRLQIEDVGKSFLSIFNPEIPEKAKYA